MFSIKIDDQLELRLLHVTNAEEMFNLINTNRPYLKEWLPWVDYTNTVEDSRQFIESTLMQFCHNNGFQAGIFYENKLVGMIGLHPINWANRATAIGYWLAESHQGKGIMTKACDTVLQYAFEFLQLNRLEIRAAAENVKSQAIPKRLGFIYEGRARQSEWLYDHYVDHEVFCMLREDYMKM